MLVKVGKLIFLMNFVIIDIEDDKKITLFLGRPFLNTGAALIDVKKGDLSLRVGIEEVLFNLNQSLKQHDFKKAQCMRVDILIHVSKVHNEDPLKECMINSLYNGNLEKEELKAKVKLTNAV